MEGRVFSSEFKPFKKIGQILVAVLSDHTTSQIKHIHPSETTRDPGRANRGLRPSHDGCEDAPRCVGRGGAPRGAGARGTYVVEVGDDLVEEPQALQALLVNVRLGVELLEVRDGGEHHADAGVGLVVQVLRAESGGRL